MPESKCGLCGAVALYRHGAELRCRLHKDTLKDSLRARDFDIAWTRDAPAREARAILVERSATRKALGLPLLRPGMRATPEVGRHRAGISR